MDPFIAEIRIFAGNFAPNGWAFCNGQLLPISQNPALFSILGTIYGGDGKSVFALPNLQGVAPMQCGQGPGLSNYDIGETGGETSVTLIESQIPVHTHPVRANSNSGDQTSPQNNDWAASSNPMYSASAGSSPAMNPAAFSPAGGNQPHNNMPPYLVLNFIIAMQGVFPPRS